MYNKSDLGIGMLSVLWKRSQVVSYTSNVHIIEYTFLQRKPEKQVNLYFMIAPFSSSVWWAVVVCIIFISISYYFMYKFYYNIGKENGLCNESRIDSFILLTLMPIIGEGKERAVWLVNFSHSKIDP